MRRPRSSSSTRALDGGITFYDCCWEYSRGKAEDWLGKGLKGQRDKAFLMTKVCTHGRDASLATQMLEQSLRRLQTDHIDLWQIHGVGFANDPDLFIRPGGAAEALLKAKKEGKVRFVGFTGHKDPEVHLAMLNTGFPFDAVQMPLNPFDANFHQFSFEQKVLPVLNQRGIAVLGMKPICGHGEPVQQGIFTAQEMLRYAMSLPVTTTISGFGEHGHPQAEPQDRPGLHAALRDRDAGAPRSRQALRRRRPLRAL